MSILQQREAAIFKKPAETLFLRQRALGYSVKSWFHISRIPFLVGYTQVHVYNIILYMYYHVCILTFCYSSVLLFYQNL